MSARKKEQNQNIQRYSGSEMFVLLFNVKWWHTNLVGSELGPGVVVGVGVDRLGLAISSPEKHKEDSSVKMIIMIYTLEWYGNTQNVSLF